MRLSVKAFGVVLVITLVLMLPLIFVRPLVVLGDSWATNAPMPKAVVGHGVAAVDEKIYVIGGADYDVWVVNNTWQYDPASDTWAAKASMPTARSNFGIAVYGGKI